MPSGFIDIYIFYQLFAAFAKYPDIESHECDIKDRIVTSRRTSQKL